MSIFDTAEELRRQLGPISGQQLPEQWFTYYRRLTQQAELANCALGAVRDGVRAGEELSDPLVLRALGRVARLNQTCLDVRSEVGGRWPASSVRRRYLLHTAALVVDDLVPVDRREQQAAALVSIERLRASWGQPSVVLREAVARTRLWLCQGFETSDSETSAAAELNLLDQATSTIWELTGAELGHAGFDFELVDLVDE